MKMVHMLERYRHPLPLFTSFRFAESLYVITSPPSLIVTGIFSFPSLQLQEMTSMSLQEKEVYLRIDDAHGR